MEGLRVSGFRKKLGVADVGRGLSDYGRASELKCIFSDDPSICPEPYRGFPQKAADHVMIKTACKPKTRNARL